VCSEVGQKAFFPGPIAGGIDVGKTESRGIAIKRKVERESVTGGKRVHQIKNVLIPGRKETTTGSHRVNGRVVAEIGRKEGGAFLGRKRTQFGFLERNQAGPGGGKVSTNGNTLVVLTQPANVPSLNGKA
jgi:hypothetical protein